VIPNAPEKPRSRGSPGNSWKLKVLELGISREPGNSGKLQENPRPGSWIFLGTRERRGTAGNSKFWNLGFPEVIRK